MFPILLDFHYSQIFTTSRFSLLSDIHYSLMLTTPRFSLLPAFHYIQIFSDFHYSLIFTAHGFLQLSVFHCSWIFTSLQISTTRGLSLLPDSHYCTTNSRFVYFTHRIKSLAGRGGPPKQVTIVSYVCILVIALSVAEGFFCLFDE